MITSADNSPWIGDVAIPDLESAGLPHDSVVRPAKIATVEAGRAARIGRLAPATRARVAEAIRLRIARSS
jgi:mRNA interferase MazF